ncbi:MAG: cobalamin-dependent protein [Spirochaetales bacterium]|nr:cobalamin-dependent protein [Spirochaetales bacterium]
MRIVFAQLPLQESLGEGARDNEPYAAGLLVAAAERAGLLHRDECLILDGDLMDTGGDAAICSAIAEAEPEIAVFSLFDWNLDRSIWIARKLRPRLPGTVLLAGGPAAVPDDEAIRQGPFDVIIEGEGEIAFAEFLADRAMRSHKHRYRAATRVAPGSIVDPYLSGVLKVNPARRVRVESARGSLQHSMAWVPREGLECLPLAPSLAARVARLASKERADELLVVAPLGSVQDLELSLKELAGANDSGVPVELVLDPALVSEEAARLAADAAVETVRHELPTVTPAALEALGARFDREAFERGAEALWNSGIRTRAGLRIGLPGEDYDAIIDAFDFLGMAGLGQDADVLPLAVAPGSRWRADPTGHGIKEFLERPPYYVLETDWLDEDDLIDAIGAFEESFDVAWNVPTTPNFAPERGGFVSFADLRRAGALDRLALAPERLANSVTLLLGADDPENIARAARAARELLKENPFTLWQIVLWSNSSLPARQTVRKLADAFSAPEHYYELSRAFSLDPQRGFQARLFFATRTPSLALASLKEAADLETIFVLDNEPARGWERVIEQWPFLAFDRDATGFSLLYDAMNAYRAYPDLVLEAPSELWK